MVQQMFVQLASYTDNPLRQEPKRARNNSAKGSSMFF